MAQFKVLSELCRTYGNNCTECINRAPENFVKGDSGAAYVK